MFTTEAMITPIKTPIKARPIPDRSFFHDASDSSHDNKHQGTDQESLIDRRLHVASNDKAQGKAIQS